ncbi:jg17715, partial [Pararge aegeria aegeria]
VTYWLFLFLGLSQYLVGLNSPLYLGPLPAGSLQPAELTPEAQQAAQVAECLLSVAEEPRCAASCSTTPLHWSITCFGVSSGSKHALHRGLSVIPKMEPIPTGYALSLFQPL